MLCWFWTLARDYLDFNRPVSFLEPHLKYFKLYTNVWKKSRSTAISKQNLSSKRHKGSIVIYITWNKRKKWSLIDQKDFKTKLYNIDIFSTRRTTILQIFIIIDSNERKLYKSSLKYNGTLFRVDVKLYKYPNETSWELINVKANNIKANVSYVEEDTYKLLHEKNLHRARTIYFYYVGRIHLEMALIVI